MERGYRRSNPMTLFGVEQIPGVDRIRNIVDGIAAEGLSGAFDTALTVAREQGVLEEYRVLNGAIPVAPDGVWCFSSAEAHCERCLRMEKKKRKGETGTGWTLPREVNSIKRLTPSKTLRGRLLIRSEGFIPRPLGRY
jgi:hypothetical protein